MENFVSKICPKPKLKKKKKNQNTNICRNPITEFCIIVPSCKLIKLLNVYCQGFNRVVHLFLKNTGFSH